ncbi:hypothetical protein Sya03_47180 [Spirilliplanes yamanashiensis]|uniref:Uncharacterized protein n=1 Tax=Spirilliplanes yamanashiensis TaxID=42233 RepID=A0A8J4DKW8_9ACTN|nr:hypothetical protein Sya03_47180 [Spirilliplanes yamanashiensis]
MPGGHRGGGEAVRDVGRGRDGAGRHLVGLGAGAVLDLGVVAEQVAGERQGCRRRLVPGQQEAAREAERAEAAAGRAR